MKCPLCGTKKVFYIDEGEYGCVRCGVAFTSTGVIYDDDWELDKGNLKIL